jgi:hypothetical protein
VPNTGVSSLQVTCSIFPPLFTTESCVLWSPKTVSCPLFPQLTGLKIFQNGVAGIDIIAPLSNGFMITSCFAFQNKMSIPSDPQSLVSNNLFK